MRTPTALACLLVAGAAVAETPDRSETPTVGPRDLVIDGSPVKVILPPDRIAAISQPELLDAEAADEVYAPDEPVLGVVLGGEAHAYSLWHLDHHEIVNDEVGGRAIAATW